MDETRITIAHGDGIGPEVMAASLNVLEAAQARLSYDTVEIGEKVYKKGISSGIEEKTWETILKNKVFFKGPITTPQGGGFKSLNVTVRKTLGLYANVRPCQSYAPYVKTKHPKMDLVIIRENEEDLYAGIEHRQTQEVYQCLKLITRPGCEKIARYAFEYALRAGRKKVTCLTKDNIMKMTDGLFHRVFDELGQEYPTLKKEHWIVDIGAAKLADTPEDFDVVVMPNLYGDILSDVTAQIAGSVGFAGSANIGEECAMFEAIHGSAPLLAGLGVANPSGLILASVQMLEHLGQGATAERIHNAWLKTIEDGIHTKDIFGGVNSCKLVGTRDFALAVIERLGEEPISLAPVRYLAAEPLKVWCKPQKKPESKELCGVDVFVNEDVRDPDRLADLLIKATGNEETLRLEMITNRGVKVYPNGQKSTFCTDHWRCRFSCPDDNHLRSADVWGLLKKLDESGIDVIKTENLYRFEGQKAFSAGQGQ